MLEFNAPGEVVLRTWQGELMQNFSRVLGD